MNAEQLLGYFDRISEAPGAIPRLRRFILDLAVRGKLVAQDTSDEPASELIERIEAHKARLAGRGRLKVPKRCARLNGGQTSSKLRRGWQTATIADLLVEIQTGPFGSSLHQSDYQRMAFPSSIRHLCRVRESYRYPVWPSDLRPLKDFPLSSFALGTS